MRYSQSEKMEVINIVEGSDLDVKATLAELGIHRSTFYEWYRKYEEGGYDGLAPKRGAKHRFWNAIPPREREKVIELALDNPERSPRGECKIFCVNGYSVYSDKGEHLWPRKIPPTNCWMSFWRARIPRRSWARTVFSTI
jgi:transposase-like protein